MKIIPPLAALAMLLCSGLSLSAEDAKWRPSGASVLVVYASDDADSDGSGTPDSQDLANYYAQKRGVPKDNLLGVSVNRGKGKNQPWTYAEFYERILTPVAQKLQGKSASGQPLSETICYVLVCPGIPQSMHIPYMDPKATKEEKSWWKKTLSRSVDSWLINPIKNYQAGVSAETGLPGEKMTPALGTVESETSLPLTGQYAQPDKARHFRQLRQDNPKVFDFFLVTRLGTDLQTGRDMLDGAIYAERYLRLPADSEKTDYRPHIWLDGKPGFAADHIASMARMLQVVQGFDPSPLGEGKGLRRVWPMVIDNQDAEIGKIVDDVQSKPKVTVIIRQVDEKGVILNAATGGDAKTGKPSGGLYFCVGDRVVGLQPAPKKPTSTASSSAASSAASSGAAVASSKSTSAIATTSSTSTSSAPATRRATPPAPVPVLAEPPPTAVVIGFDPKTDRLLLDTTKGFKPGQVLTHYWQGEFPARGCFFFYGFYGLSQYEDVLLFEPGALGIHVDSDCFKWARQAMTRGISATFGVTAEPLSAGIPYGDQVLLALSAGYDWAEASYGGLAIAQRWTGMVFGDGLYAPWRSPQEVDKTPPVIGEVKIDAKGSTVTASLAGKTPEELADVAIFKLEYGPTKEYGRTIDFYDWPEPAKSKGVAGRRFGYSRSFRQTIDAIRTGGARYYRLTARDPAGNETVVTREVVAPN